MTSTTTTLTHAIDEHRSFLEYLVTDHNDQATTGTVKALAVSVASKDCSRIIKALAQPFPLPSSLSHLKRVKKATRQNDDPSNNDVQPQKRAKMGNDNIHVVKPSNGDLQIILGLEPLSTILKNHPSSSLTDDYTKDAATALVSILLGDCQNDDDPYQVLQSLLHTVIVPGKPPQSQAQADAANRLWPTHFFPLKSIEYRHQQLSIPNDEKSCMSKFVETIQAPDGPICAMVVDPSTQTIVATSWDEQMLQQSSTQNPLSTPILHAIQGVSRLERSENPHYLCTNFDLYCNYEPTIFEAMACVHSRLGRVIFVPTHQAPGVWQNAISIHSIHCLPGTNHHFRAFEYCWTSCTTILRT